MTYVFSGKSADTRALVTKMRAFKERDKEIYKVICAEIAEVTKKIVIAINREECKDIIALIKQNRRILQRLAVASGVILETPELQRICDKAEAAGGAGKLSGAGGGDCAVVFSEGIVSDSLLKRSISVA